MWCVPSLVEHTLAMYSEQLPRLPKALHLHGTRMVEGMQVKPKGQGRFTK